MHTYLPAFAALVVVVMSGALGQSVDPLSQLVSQALSVYTGVVSALNGQPTATPASTTSTSSSSSSQSSLVSPSSPSSTSSSLTTSSLTTASSTSSIMTSTPTTPTQSASNTAAAAAASSSAAAAMAAANAQSKKNRTTAIVLGVVLGLLALAVLTGLLLFCLRRRRRQRAVGSRRPVSSEDVGGASWGKEPFSHSSITEHTPLAAPASYMTDNGLHRHEANDNMGDTRPTPHPVAANFRPVIMDGTPAGQGAHRPNQNHIPLSAHSRSNVAAAGLGGAVMGGLAAKHHHDNHHNAHDDRGFAQTSHEHQGVPRKPVGSALSRAATGPASNVGVAADAAPRYQAGYSVSPHRDMEHPSQPIEATGSTSPNSTLSNGNPPAYNGTADPRSPHPLTSHPPVEDSHRHSTGNGFPTAIAGPANHHHGDRDSSLTGRRIWDPKRQPQHPQSILANAANSRSTGSTNPYVPARSPKQARFKDDVVALDDQAHEGNRSREDLPQDNSFPKMEPISSVTQDRVRNGSPSHMPGGWRGSGEFNRAGNRASFNDDPTTGSPVQSTESRPRNPSLGDLRQQEEDGWYRGRYMGDDVRPVDSGATGHDQRFYGHRGSVGQAM